MRLPCGHVGEPGPSCKPRCPPVSAPFVLAVTRPIGRRRCTRAGCQWRVLPGAHAACPGHEDSWIQGSAVGIFGPIRVLYGTMMSDHVRELMVN